MLNFSAVQPAHGRLVVPAHENVGAKIGRGLGKISRFNGRFGVGNFGNFSIHFAAALKKHQKRSNACA